MLKVKLQSITTLKKNSIITKLEKDELLENGFNEEDKIYVTEGVLYTRKLSIKEVTLKELVDKDDKVFMTEEGYYVHSDWIYLPIDIKENVINIDSKWYTFNLEEVQVNICTECGELQVYEDGLCSSCFKEKYVDINNYSFKPTPSFIGSQIKLDKDNPVWYGVELEYSIKDTLVFAKYMRDNGKNLYLKSDSSIYNSSTVETRAEMVSHPHSFSAMMKVDWVNKLDNIPALTTESAKISNGCHIHISRTAWSDNSHYSRWYFFLYSLVGNVLNKVGGRECTSYCKDVKKGNIITKENKRGDNDRGVVINECNDETVEVRVFSSTNSSKELKAYIQLLESTIKYSKYSKTTLKYDTWYGYIVKYEDKYKELLEALGRITERPLKEIVVPTKEVKVSNIYDIPSQYLGFITNILLKDGQNVKVIDSQINFIDETVEINKRDYVFSFSKIKEITYVC